VGNSEASYIAVDRDSPRQKFDRFIRKEADKAEVSRVVIDIEVSQVRLDETLSILGGL
jgi:hypothetical protein